MEPKSTKFLKILEDHKNLIYKVANAYCKDAIVREDLIQEIILQLWTSFDKYDKQYKLSTWIYRISLNNAISFYRKKENRQIFLPLDSIFHLQEEGSEEKNEEIDRLYTYIYELKEIDRALILLHLDKLSHEEISKIIGITSSNVSTRLVRIKTKLAKRFQNG